MIDKMRARGAHSKLTPENQLSIVTVQEIPTRMHFTKTLRSVTSRVSAQGDETINHLSPSEILKFSYETPPHSLPPHAGKADSPTESPEGGGQLPPRPPLELTDKICAHRQFNVL